AGCSSPQVKPNKVGEVGFDSRYEAEHSARRAALNYYDTRAAKTSAVIHSTPVGALVEWQNREGIWVAVGNTPTSPIVIEATGRPELFRVSAPGFLPATQRIAAPPSTQGIRVDFTLVPELPLSQRIFTD